MKRRTFLAATAALPLASSLATSAWAQTRTYAPKPGEWRTFEVKTRLDIFGPGGATQAWVPVPALDTAWQQSTPGTWTGNVQLATLDTDPAYGAKMVHATWSDTEARPWIEVTSRVRTRDRAQDFTRKSAATADPAELALALKATTLMPLDGIVAETARKITAGKSTDIEKVRALYDWVVINTYREPKVRGCGVGDIRGMLETGNLGGKCADLNALFVGMCRASGIPARDLYGIRVAKSAFGYRELGANSPDITKAQHCRAEVFLADYGWVATDPADVAKVMRQETPEWIKDPANDLIAPVKAGLFGAWEGNWMAYNVAHDVALPGSRGPKVAFLMYPQGETRSERIDCLDPETFEYKITAREVTA